MGVFPQVQDTVANHSPLGKSRVASDTRVHFSIPSLSEFCLRALLSPFNPVKPSHGKDETVLEALYALPLSGTEFYPPGLIETLHACIPSAVAKPDPQIEASPAKKPRRSISTAQDPFKAPSASVVNSASRGSSVSSAEDPEKDTLLGIGNCPSPRHRAQGRRMVFVKHAEERFTWEGIIAGVRVGESFGVPLFWRGCSKDCLDFLDSPNNNTEEASQQGENIDADWEGDTEAAITDEDEDLGARPVEFGDGELGFD